MGAQRISRRISSRLSRRAFLTSTAIGATAIGGVAALGAGPPIAVALDLLEPATMDALVRMARLLYPHDALGDEVYAEVVEGLVVALPEDWSSITMLETGVSGLDTARRRPWLSLDEAEQIAVMAEIEDSDFFAAMRGGVQAGLYNHPAVWEMIGYAGSALEFGGYAVRGGSDDIDWLPEA